MRALLPPQIPSHVFERLVWQPQALALLSGHAATGERLPRPLAEAISAERRLLSATNLQSQVLLAAFDLRIHSERPPRSRADVQGIADELAAHHCAVPHGQGVAWPATFTHVVGYGASYYSYVYAHCATAALWERVLDHEPLVRRRGHLASHSPQLLCRGATGRAKMTLKGCVLCRIRRRGGTSG